MNVIWLVSLSRLCQLRLLLSFLFVKIFFSFFSKLLPRKVILECFVVIFNVYESFYLFTDIHAG